MAEGMKVVQTPKNEHGRSSGLAIRRSKVTPWNAKLASDQPKKHHKVHLKSLSHDDVSDDEKQPFILSPIFGVPSTGGGGYRHQLEISKEVANPAFNPSLSASSETLAAVSELASQSSDITADAVDDAGDSSATGSRHGCGHQADSSKVVSLEAEMVVSHLRQARSEVLNSSYASLRSKRLLEAMTNVLIEELCPLPEEKDQWINGLVAARVRVALLFLAALCLLPVFSAAFLFWPFNHPHPPPT